MIMMRRLVKIDHKVRTDINYPCGFMDVFSLERSNEHFRLLYDVKGQFKLVRIDAKEAAFKLCRVRAVGKGKKASIGRNPFKTGQDSAIPYIVTHDGRTIRYPDPDIKVNDTIKFNIEKGTIDTFYKFEVGQVAMVTRGANVGRIGVIAHIEKHPGSFDIVHVVDRRENKFATRLENVFVIGSGNTAAVTLPKKRGIHLSILEEAAKREEDKKKGNKKGKKKKRK
jgi:small subunit ribosomal protein S4e